ncbi:GAF domain-like protein, partial [Tribonema minus]
LLRSLQVVDSDAEESFDRITRLAARLFRVPICLISLVDAERQWFKARAGLSVAETPRDTSFCAYTFLTGAPDVVVVPDALRDRRFRHSPIVTGPPHLRFYAGAPLILEGVKLGALCLLDTAPHEAGAFGVADKANLVALAETVVVELQRRRRVLRGQLGHITAVAHNLQVWCQ